MTNPTPGSHHSTTAGPVTPRTLLVDQTFTERDLPALRRTVAAHADRTGMPTRRISDLVLIVSELASNAVRHGGGEGRLTLWATADAVHCEVTDDGPGPPQALPRQPPEPSIPGGRGLWLALTSADKLVIKPRNDGGTLAMAPLT